MSALSRQRFFSSDVSGKWLLVMVPVLLLLPAWIMLEPLVAFRLQGDDFSYFAASRTWARAWENLWQPHNAHVVAFFRIWTAGLMQAAGRWENLQTAAALSSYLSLVLVMAAMCRLVWRETGDPTLALGAMVAVGATTTMYAAITWYAASQTLLAGVWILGTLLAIQAWRISRGSWRLVLAGASCALACGTWSGGYAAVPVAAAYLALGKQPGDRKAAAGFLLVGGLALAVLFFTLYPRLMRSENFGDRAASDALRPFAGLGHMTQAIPEFLLLGNFGLDAPVTLIQGITLCLTLALVWSVLHRRRPIQPLEAAGITLVIVSYLLVYTVRGYLPFSSVRDLRWYHTLPHIGLVLAVAGACSSKSLAGARRLSRFGLAGVLLFSAALWGLHRSATERLILAEVFSDRADEVSKQIAITELRRQIPLEIGSRSAERQRRMLAQFDRIERLSGEFALDRESIDAAFERFEFAGLPEQFDALAMLDLVPRQGDGHDRTIVQSRLNWIDFGDRSMHPAVGSLIADLGDVEKRLGAIYLLGVMGPDARPALPNLRELLTDRDAETRHLAAQAIGRIADRLPQPTQTE